VRAVVNAIVRPWSASYSEKPHRIRHLLPAETDEKFAILHFCLRSVWTVPLTFAVSGAPSPLLLLPESLSGSVECLVSVLLRPDCFSDMSSPVSEVAPLPSFLPESLVGVSASSVLSDMLSDLLSDLLSSSPFSSGFFSESSSDFSAFSSSPSSSLGSSPPSDFSSPSDDSSFSSCSPSSWCSSWP
jgi:hypothetical protein